MLINIRVFSFLPLTLALAFAAHADSASDFGRAQTNKNSYEAQREWRQRNVKPIQLGTVPTLPVYDNRPRSSAEINAEQERKMEAMHARWATKPLTEAEQAAVQAAGNRRDAEEMRVRWEKTYPRMMKKARKAVVGNDKKWTKFLQSLTYEERRILSGHNDYTFHSPLADIGRDVLAGTREEPGDIAMARLVWTRCWKLDDNWCAYDLGMLEASSGTAAGYAAALEHFNHCRPYDNGKGENWNKGAPICAVEVARAHAFGLGVPVDTRKAQELIAIASRFGFHIDSLSPPYPDEEWVQYQMFLAALFSQGVVYGQDVAKARSILFAVANNPKSPMPWRALLPLLEAGGDLDDKARSWRLLNDASAAGRSEAGGYLAVKLMKGEGVDADLEGGYALAMGLPGMTPQATAQAAKFLLRTSPAKAAALIERHALKEDAELQALLAQAKNPTVPGPAREEPAKAAGSDQAAPVSGGGAAGIEWVSIPAGNGIGAFRLARTEVTNKQYRACVSAGACTPAGSSMGGDEHPVVNVDWHQAKAFSSWAGGRLPTEKEWEHAARGGAETSRRYPWGDAEATCARAVFTGCGTGTAPVCSAPAGNNIQGLCDMSGNVQEWTADWYSGAPADSPEQAGAARSFRGGAWNGSTRHVGFRDGNIPGSRANDVGFRPAR